MNARGQYGNSYGQPSRIGRELTDAEVREATEAGNRAAQPLIDDHNRMMRAWAADKPLTREQMLTIMREALAVARGVEKDLVTTISKVPEHWEQMVRREGGLLHLRQGIAEAPAFEALIEKAVTPTVVPGFRNWIDRLFMRSESGVIAIGAAQNILPDWLRMRDILSRLHGGAVAAINAVLSLGGAAIKAVGGLPTALKVGGIAVLAIGGVWAISKLSSARGVAGAR